MAGKLCCSINELGHQLDVAVLESCFRHIREAVLNHAHAPSVNSPPLALVLYCPTITLQLPSTRIRHWRLLVQILLRQAKVVKRYSAVES
jgi:hypothetical protein